jgi:hypothetical protein
MNDVRVGKFMKSPFHEMAAVSAVLHKGWRHSGGQTNAGASRELRNS